MGQQGSLPNSICRSWQETFLKAGKEKQNINFFKGQNKLQFGIFKRNAEVGQKYSINRYGFNKHIKEKGEI